MNTPSSSESGKNAPVADGAVSPAKSRTPKSRNTRPLQAGRSSKPKPEKIRYAVVGLGYFAQVAILPAFKHAGRNSELVALVSDDVEKLESLGQEYGVKTLCGYGAFGDLMESGEIDSVYIALPNDMHRDFAVRAARAGVHVLVEKPMAVTERECEDMIRAANESHVRLMVAYRLHLSASNLSAIEAVHSGEIGEPRFFSGAFSMQVKDGNIRTQAERGGGPLHDLGIYCINAARYLFRSEPLQVTAIAATREGDPRFSEIDEMLSVILRFPENRLAQFTCSFGADDVSAYEVVGDRGSLRLEQAYEYAMPSVLKTTVNGKTSTRKFGKKDQMAAEILYFSECLLKGREPEPSGIEGLADIRTIQAILESARTGEVVTIDRVDKGFYPSKDMEVNRPPVEKPELVHADSPSQD